ncbi:MAG: hypothetical protein ACJ70T_03265 [Nitrososphaera sp.]
MSSESHDFDIQLSTIQEQSLLIEGQTPLGEDFLFDTHQAIKY